MSGTDSPVNDESGGLGEQSKLLALGVAVMYAAGLFATNAFLRQHEISDFSLLRPKALFTGALVVGSLGIIAFVPLHVVADLIDRRQNSIAITTRFLGTFAIRLLAPWILLAAVLWISAADDSSPLFDSFFGERRPLLIFLRVAGELYVAACTTATLAVASTVFFRRATEKISYVGMSKSWAKFVICAAGSLLGFACYVWVFATSLYPVIPQPLGGGRPEAVRFLIKSDAVPAVRQLGIYFVPGTNITERLPLIYESETTASVEVSYRIDLPVDKAKGEIARYFNPSTTVSLERSIVSAFIVDFVGLGDVLPHLPSERVDDWR